MNLIKEREMKVRLQCDRCQTVYIVEDDAPDAASSFARHIAREGCDCGGHTVSPICGGDDDKPRHDFLSAGAE